MSDFKILYSGANYQLDVTEALTGIREKEEETDWDKYANFWNNIADAIERKYKDGNLCERK